MPTSRADLARRIFLDTNVFKFAAVALRRWKPRQQRGTWAGMPFEITVHDMEVVNPNDRLRNQRLRREASLLPRVAELAKMGALSCVSTLEGLVEEMGLPKMDSQTGRFFGAPVEVAKPPIAYQRIIISPLDDSRDLQGEFLKSITHPRFLELQKITGGYQGVRKYNLNQMIDAFLLWCAESAGSDFFLTLDFKMVDLMLRIRKGRYNVRVVTPSELLREIST